MKAHTKPSVDARASIGDPKKVTKADAKKHDLPAGGPKKVEKGKKDKLPFVTKSVSKKIVVPKKVSDKEKDVDLMKGPLFMSQHGRFIVVIL